MTLGSPPGGQADMGVLEELEELEHSDLDALSLFTFNGTTHMTLHHIGYRWDTRIVGMIVLDQNNGSSVSGLLGSRNELLVELVDWKEGMSWVGGPACPAT